MALNADTTRAARSLITRRQLVEAVLAAPEHEPELEWIEWKVPPDIQAHRGVIAKQILAFANREVSRAARTAEGCGYLLLGASPGGKLVGVAPVDSADLSNWLDPFVGGVDGPQWDPDYVDINGRSVLVITVAPPRDGDRAWPLRKEWNQGQGAVLQEGWVFTRRLGKSVHANAAEQDMLLARSRAAGRRLTVDLRCQYPELGRTYVASADAVSEWVAEERARLLAPLPKPKASPASGLRDTLGAEEMLARLSEDMRRSLLLAGLQEDRTEEQYRAEVADYLTAASVALEGRARWKAVSMGLAALRLQAVNLTESPFAKLEIQVHVPGAVRAYWSPGHVRPRDDFPSAPRLWGPRLNAMGFRGATYLRPYISDALLGVAPEPFKGRIRNTGSATVTYPPFDIRPTETRWLDVVWLAADAALAGETLTVTWEATSTSALGRNAGAFDVRFAAEPVSLRSLLGSPDADSEETDEDE